MGKRAHRGVRSAEATARLDDRRKQRRARAERRESPPAHLATAVSTPSLPPDRDERRKSPPAPRVVERRKSPHAVVERRKSPHVPVVKEEPDSQSEKGQSPRTPPRSSKRVERRESPPTPRVAERRKSPHAAAERRKSPRVQKPEKREPLERRPKTAEKQVKVKEEIKKEDESDREFAGASKRWTKTLQDRSWSSYRH